MKYGKLRPKSFWPCLNNPNFEATSSFWNNYLYCAYFMFSTLFFCCKTQKPITPPKDPTLFQPKVQKESDTPQIRLPKCLCLRAPAYEIPNAGGDAREFVEFGLQHVVNTIGHLSEILRKQKADFHSIWLLHRTKLNAVSPIELRADAFYPSQLALVQISWTGNKEIAPGTTAAPDIGWI